MIRIARHEGAAAGHERELRLLPTLAGRLPVALPEPRRMVEPDADFPFGAVGYPRLAGEPLDPAAADERLALDVARFLRALHTVADVGLATADGDLEPLRQATLPPLRERLTAGEQKRLQAWWDAVLADERLSNYEPRLRHGDLWYDNLLAAGGRLVGVLDWAAAGLGDVAQDFAALRHAGAHFAAAVLAAYAPEHDSRLRHRVERRWELRELYGVRLATELEDEEELADSVRKLRARPILAVTQAQ